jgi:hypothetical protein
VYLATAGRTSKEQLDGHLTCQLKGDYDHDLVLVV